MWRLYLPQQWLEDTTRAKEVRLPPGMVYRSKSELALEAIDQALAWGLPPSSVLVDSAYGNDFSFRQALRERQLQYAVQVEPSTVVWTENPKLPMPAPEKKKRGGRENILPFRRWRGRRVWKGWRASCRPRPGAV